MKKGKILPIVATCIAVPTLATGVASFVQLSNTDFTGIRAENVGSELETGAKKLNFAVQGNRLLGYTGTELSETLEIPASYSLANARSVDYSFDEYTLRDFLLDIEEQYMGSSANVDDELFEYTFKDATGEVYVCKTLEDLQNLDPAIRQKEQNLLQPYPVTTTIIEYDAVEGTDIAITEIRDFGMLNISENYKQDYEYSKVKTLKIPASITTFSNSGHLQTLFDNLEQCIVDKDNKNFESVDGCLITKDTGLLTLFPAGKTGEYTLPKEIKGFDEHNGFFQNSKLDKLIFNDVISEIYSSTFQGSQVKTVVMNNKITTIPNSCFNNSKTQKIQLSNALTTIDVASFSRCSYLEEISIPEGVTQISQQAFAYCSSLTKVTLPTTITEIGVNAFNYCKKLETVNLSDLTNLVTIGGDAFNYCSSLDNIELPNNVKTIGNGAFAYSAISSINIPNSVTELGTSLCINCTNLTSATVGTGLTTIPQGTFTGCAKLERVTLFGTNITSITRAFENTGTFKLQIHTATPPTLTINNTLNISELIVPTGAIETYRSAWSGKMASEVTIREFSEY